MPNKESIGTLKVRDAEFQQLLEYMAESIPSLVTHKHQIACEFFFDYVGEGRFECAGLQVNGNTEPFIAVSLRLVCMNPEGNA